MPGGSLVAGLPAPIYPEMPAEELGHFGRGGRARFAVAEDQEQVDKLLELRARTGAATHIIYDDPRGIGASDGRGLFAYGDVAERGQARLDAAPALARELPARARPHDGARLLHSSGTPPP